MSVFKKLLSMNVQNIYTYIYIYMTTRWQSCLRHLATSRKGAVSIPDGVIGIFHWHNPSGRIMALGLTQPLTEMSTRNITWYVKTAGAYGWQPYHLHVPTVLKSWSLNLLETSGPFQASNGISFTYCFIAQDLQAQTVHRFQNVTELYFLVVGTRYTHSRKKRTSV